MEGQDKQLKQLQEEISFLKEQKTQQNTLFTELQKEKEELLKSQDNLKKETQTQKTDITSLNNKIQVIQNEKEALQKNQENSVKEIQTQKTEITSLNNKIQVVQTEKEVLQKNQENSAQEIQTQKTQVTDLNNKIQVLQNEKEALQKQQDNSAKEIQTQKTQVTNLNNRIQVLQNEKEALQKQQDNSAKEIQTQKTDITSLNNKVQVAQKEKEALQKNQENLAKEIQTQKTEITSLNNKIQVLQKEKGVLQKQQENSAKEIQTSKSDICLLSNNIQILQNENEALQKQQENLAKEIQTYQSDITQLNNNIVELQNQQEELINVQEDQKQEIETLIAELSTKEQEIQELKQENTDIKEKAQEDLENQNQNLSQTIEDIQKEKDLLQNQQLDLQQQNQKLKDELLKQETNNSTINSELKTTVEELQLKNQELVQQTEKLIKEQLLYSKYSKQFQEIDSEDESKKLKYDFTIEMKSLFDLQKIDENSSIQGLQVKQINQDIQENLDDCVCIGLLGGTQTGKTFVLDKLIESNHQSITSANQPGIYIKVDTKQDKKFIYFHRVGHNNPITLDYQNNQNYTKFLAIKKKSKKTDIESKNSLENDISHSYKDIKATQQMLQGFIVENSNVLLIVIYKLNCQNQKLINTVSKQFLPQNTKQNNNQKILVIHNLKDYHNPKNVQEYIEELKLNYPVKLQPSISYQKIHENEFFYVLIDEINTDIHHVIMANEYSEAGQVFNSYAISYLKSTIGMCYELNDINLKESFYSYLDENLNKYAVIQSTNNETLTGNTLKLIKETNSITLSDQNSILSIKDEKMSVSKHEIFKSEDGNKIYLLIEEPHKVVMTRIYDEFNSKLHVRVEQLKDDQVQEPEVQKRKLVDKYYEIQIDKSQNLWREETDSKKDLKNGVHLFVFSKISPQSYS